MGRKAPRPPPPGGSDERPPPPAVAPAARPSDLRERIDRATVQLVALLAAVRAGASSAVPDLERDLCILAALRAGDLALDLAEGLFAALLREGEPAREGSDPADAAPPAAVPPAAPR